MDVGGFAKHAEHNMSPDKATKKFKALFDAAPADQIEGEGVDAMIWIPLNKERFRDRTNFMEAPLKKDQSK